jgi:Thiamine pyrophosphate enzyme, N-terminal TPP binding domain
LALLATRLIRSPTLFATARLGVCCGTTGPGSTHLVAGLHEASRDYAPVLALSGDMPRKMQGTEYFQATDPNLLFRDVSLYTETNSSPAQAPSRHPSGHHRRLCWARRRPDQFVSQRNDRVAARPARTPRAAGPLPPLAIPATLHAPLLARLDRLASVKDVAQIGAVIGREFSYNLLAAAAW